jgi:S-formylglutathione hydrolase
MPTVWKRVQIADKPADVFAPADGARRRFAILFLHDMDGRTLRDDPTFTPLLEATGLACVCPFGNRAWWTDRISPEFDPKVTAERYVLDCVLPLFSDYWGLEPRAIGLLGVGMGGQGALRLAFKHPRLFPVVAAISPIIEYHELYGRGTPLDGMYDSKEQCRQDTAILHLHPTQYPPHIFYCIGSDDPWYRGSDRLSEKMNALGVPHAHMVDVTPSGETSYLDRMAEPALRFVIAGLETESRRLL